MDSGTTHHLKADLEILGIHFAYQGLEEVTICNGSKIPISHIGKSLVVISEKNSILLISYMFQLLLKICGLLVLLKSLTMFQMNFSLPFFD